VSIQDEIDQLRDEMIAVEMLRHHRKENHQREDVHSLQKSVQWREDAVQHLRDERQKDEMNRDVEIEHRKREINKNIQGESDQRVDLNHLFKRKLLDSKIVRVKSMLRRRNH
jgi:hypothetical protein